MGTILIVTNRFDSHVDYLIPKLRAQGIAFTRLNTDDYPSSILATISHQSDSEAMLQVGGDRFTENDISSIWFRRPLKYGVLSGNVSPQAQKFSQDEARAFFEGLWLLLNDKLWVSHPRKISVAEQKPFQLRLARKIGFHVPDTLITNDPEAFLAFWESHKGEVIYKALGRNIVEADNGRLLVTYTNKLDESFIQRMGDISLAPCLFQQYIPKRLELRITVVGSLVFTCEIHSQASEKTRVDWRHYDLKNTPHVAGKLPDELESLCVKLVNVLGLKFGAIDMILTPEGEYVFVEINPNGQWLWIELLSGLKISDALVDLLRGESA